MGKFRLAAFMLLVFAVLGCGGGSQAPSPLEEAQIRISPGDLSLFSEASVALSVAVFDESLNEETISWNSSASGVVSVSSVGRITAVGTGEATITASLPGASGVEDSILVSVVAAPSTENAIPNLTLLVSSVESNTGLFDISQVMTFSGDAEDKPYLIFENTGSLGFLVPASGLAQVNSLSQGGGVQTLSLSDLTGTDFTFGDVCVRSAVDAALHLAGPCVSDIIQNNSFGACDLFNRVSDLDIVEFVGNITVTENEEALVRLFQNSKSNSSLPECFDPAQFQITPNSIESFAGDILHFNVTGPSTGGISVDTNANIPWRVISNADDSLVTSSAVMAFQSTLQDGLSAVSLNTFVLTPQGREEYTIEVIVPLIFSGAGLSDIQDFRYSVVATASLRFEAFSTF